MKKTVSLCMIVGNVEEYIERCLKSFLPIADEVCIVRAIGSAAPDRTVEIAQGMCLARDIPFRTADYRNKPEHADWSHIDDFAAARQMSFDLASGEYCFWCDSDDVLEAGADQVRELAERGGYAAFVFPYRIFARGVNVPRERMLLRTAGRWQYPVHECFKFHVEPAPGVEDQRVIVTHLPHLSKHGSNDRNLKILRSIPEEEMTAGLWYHLQSELALVGDEQGSIKAAKRALSDPGLGRPERYELWLNLARLTKDPKWKESFLHEAYKTDPTRREALGLLTCGALDYGRPGDALAFARQMIATRRPAEIAWNDREAAYGWLGDEIYSQALRGNGLYDQAEIVRLEALKNAGGPRIALVHATRGRPQQAALTRKMWFDLAERPDRIEHIFVFDEDDEASLPLRRMHHLIVPAGGGCVAAWNMGAIATAAPVIIQLSDDWTPVPQWDELILQRLGNVNEPKVLAISDGLRNDKLLCMAICTRAYLLHDFFLFHPWFTGVYSDNWFTEQAYKRKAVIEARDIVFSHDHFLKTGKEPDETYLRQNAPERYAEGEAILEELRRGTDFSTVHGWFNYWPFYRFLANQLRDGDVVVEVGTWLGRSLIFLAQELKRAGKKVRLIAVDTFKGELNQPAHADIVASHGGSIRAAFEANLARCGVADMVEIIEGDSAESAGLVPDGSLAACYIDAAHDYESVKRDVAAWRGKVRPGGIFAGHDAQHEPVMRAVREAISDVTILGPCWMATPKNSPHPGPLPLGEGEPA